MPVKRCSKNGKSGYKWGDEGKCYTGSGAKKKAIEQGRAIEANKSKGAKEGMIAEMANKFGRDVSFPKEDENA